MGKYKGERTEERKRKREIMCFCSTAQHNAQFSGSQVFWRAGRKEHTHTKTWCFLHSICFPDWAFCHTPTYYQRLKRRKDREKSGRKCVYARETKQLVGNSWENFYSTEQHLSTSAPASALSSIFIPSNVLRLELDIIIKRTTMS